MNANELANKLADEVDIHVAMGGSTFFKEVSNMLRQFGLAESIVKQQQAEVEALKEQLNFITNINRLGLGVQKENGLTSSEIEKVWLSIEEQKDDNFHYGWKKCEQYYGIRKASEK